MLEQNGIIDFSVKDEKQEASLTGLAVKLLNLRQEKKGTETVLDDLKEEIAQVEQEMYARMEDASLDSIKTNKFTFYRRKDVYFSFKDKEAGFEWLRDNGFEWLIQPSVNSRTLTAELKARREEGEEEVDSTIFNEKTVNRIGIKR